MSELLNQQLRGSIALLDAPPQPLSPMGMVQLALEKGAFDQIEKLMDLSDRFEANLARKAYVQAMADFKNEEIVITKDKKNAQYGSKYSSIGNLVNTVTPLLSKHGLSAEWTLDQSDGIRVGCMVTHALGHSGETKWMKVPLDTSGAKNPLQQLKSSITYAKICTYEMATGLASAEANLDDDGNASGKKSEAEPEGMSQEDFDYHMQRIEAAQNKENLLVIFTAAYKAALALKDEGAMRQFGEAKEKRKAAL